MDIFDSFWGDSAPKEKKKEDEKPVKKLQDNINLHLEKSLEYYLSVNNPALGLLFYLNNKNKIEETECNKFFFLKIHIIFFFLNTQKILLL